MDDARRTALLEEYREVAQNFRLLTDIRFKLLAFLPIAAATAAALRGEGSGDAAEAATTLALFVFGLVATLGLATYNARNDQHYDALVGRAAAIERSLGLPDGAFANRPRSWLTIAPMWSVGHRNSVALIYAASVALWLFSCLALGLEVSYDLLDKGPDRSDPPAWTTVLVLAVSIAATLGGTLVIARRRKATETRLRALARRAVELVERVVPTGVQDGALNEGFRELAGVDDKPAGGASADAASGRQSSDFLTVCEELAEQDRETLQARISFFDGLDPVSMRTYLPVGSDQTEVAAQFVAVVTDLPPEWILDCATQRRRKVSLPDRSESAVVHDVDSSGER